MATHHVLTLHMTKVSAVFVLAAVLGSAANATDFFAGKTIRLIAPGTDAAGGYGLYGLLAAHHLGRFIPGRPSIVISQMPGAGGLHAMNYLHEVAPRDGTAIAVIVQDLAAQQVLGIKGVRFDAIRFNYIGRAAANVGVHMVWHSAAVKSIEDLKQREVITGTVGTSGNQIDVMRAQNALMGTRWKVITGYRSTSDTRLAMERGETQAAIGPATLFSEQLKPWLEKGQVNVVVQYGDFRHPIFRDIPTIVELADTPVAKGVFKFLVSASTVGRAFAAPPDVPAERVAILRNAFNAMVNDPEFKADADKRGADLLAMPGEELADYIKSIVATPPTVLQKTKEVIGAN